MKENVWDTALILRSGARDLHRWGGSVHAVGQLLALADVAEQYPAQFSRLAGAALAALPGEPENPEPGPVELAAYQKEFGPIVV